MGELIRIARESMDSQVLKLRELDGVQVTPVATDLYLGEYDLTLRQGPVSLKVHLVYFFSRLRMQLNSISWLAWPAAEDLVSFLQDNLKAYKEVQHHDLQMRSVLWVIQALSGLAEACRRLRLEADNNTGSEADLGVENTWDDFLRNIPSFADVRKIETTYLDLDEYEVTLREGGVSLQIQLCPGLGKFYISSGEGHGWKNLINVMWLDDLSQSETLEELLVRFNGWKNLINVMWVDDLSQSEKLEELLVRFRVLAGENTRRQKVVDDAVEEAQQVFAIQKVQRPWNSAPVDSPEQWYAYGAYGDYILTFDHGIFFVQIRISFFSDNSFSDPKPYFYMEWEFGFPTGAMDYMLRKAQEDIFDGKSLLVVLEELSESIRLMSKDTEAPQDGEDCYCPICCLEISFVPSVFSRCKQCKKVYHTTCISAWFGDHDRIARQIAARILAAHEGRLDEAESIFCCPLCKQDFFTPRRLR